MSYRTMALVLCVLGLASATVAAGCGDSEQAGVATSATAAAGSDDPQMTIGESVPQLGDPQLKTTHDALVAQSERYGNKVVTVDANGDPNKQLADVQSLIQQDVDALVVFPIVPEAMRGAFDAARKAGIPLIVRQTSTGGPYFTNLTSDLRAMGAGLADVLADQLEPGAKVAAITGPKTADVFRERDAAFVAQARARGLDVVATASNDKVLPEESAAIVQSWKQKYGSSLKGLYDTVAALAAADVAALDASFRPLVVTYGGADANNIDALKRGRFFAMSDGNDVVVGKAEAWAANMAARKLGELPETVYYPNPILDASNVDDVPAQAQQLEQPMEFSVRQRGGKAVLEVRE